MLKKIRYIIIKKKKSQLRTRLKRRRDNSREVREEKGEKEKRVIEEAQWGWNFYTRDTRDFLQGTYLRIPQSMRLSARQQFPRCFTARAQLSRIYAPAECILPCISPCPLSYNEETAASSIP